MSLEIEKISLNLLSDLLDNSKKSVFVNKKDIINRNWNKDSSKINVVLSYNILYDKPQFNTELIYIDITPVLRSSEIEKSDYIRNYCKDIINRFNKTIKPHEKKRKFIKCYYIEELIKFTKI